jgi:hypothetical protein
MLAPGRARARSRAGTRQARRTVARWLLAALLERGPLEARRPRAAVPVERPLSAHEVRRRLAGDRRLPLAV